MKGVKSLGNLEVVTATNRQDSHINALETIVDELREENRNLKRELSLKPSTITQEQYDSVCAKLQECYTSDLPF